MSVQSEITRLQNAKAAIKAAIEGKGVTVPEATLLDGMASLIESIEAGGSGIQVYTKNIVFAEDVKSTFNVDISDIPFDPERRKTSWVVFQTGVSNYGLHISADFTAYYDNGSSGIRSASSGRTLTGTSTNYSYGIINCNRYDYTISLEFTGSRNFCAKAGSEYTLVGIKLIE